jgi:hypothetical protein
MLNREALAHLFSAVDGLLLFPQKSTGEDSPNAELHRSQNGSQSRQQRLGSDAKA